MLVLLERYFTNNGVPYAGYEVRVFLSQSSVPAKCYVQNGQNYLKIGNSAITDSAGKFSVFVEEGRLYDLRLCVVNTALVVKEVHQVDTGSASTSSSTPAGPRPQRDVGYYGVISSTTKDQTTAIQTACSNASSDGVDLFWPPGTYVRTSTITSAVSWLGVDNRLVEHRMNGTNGTGGLIDFTGSSGCKKIRFTSPLTPPNAVNNAVENDGAIRFAGTTSTEVEDCVFVNLFGTCVMMRNVVGGRILRNQILGCYKDGFHITGLSQDILRQGNLVENGGDDAFSVVGYASGGTIGRPEGITDSNNIVRGVKMGRAFSYVGAVGIQNIGCQVNGTIPSAYGRAATEMSCCAMIITAEDAFDTFGNDDIDIIGFKARNVGRGGSPFPATLHAIQLNGRGAYKSRGIRFRNLSIRNTAGRAIFVNGGVAAGIEDLTFEQLDIRNTQDPLGYTGTANTGKYDAMEFQRVHNLTVKGSVENAGAGALTTTTNCSGRVIVDLVARYLNRGNKTGSCRGIQLADATTSVDRFDVKFHLEAQESVLASGTIGFLDAPVMLLPAQPAKQIEWK